MDRLCYLEILEKAMIPSARSIRGLDYIFMHDNASCRKAHLITDWMDVNFTTWPAQSPDLNPIENLWDYLERKLEKLPTTTLSQLWDTKRSLGEYIIRDNTKSGLVNVVKNQSCYQSKGWAHKVLDIFTHKKILFYLVLHDNKHHL